MCTSSGYPDPMMGEYGARGIGEIGLAGVAPAITAAVYHATGVRVRELPVRIEDLLTVDGCVTTARVSAARRRWGCADRPAG